MKVITLGILLQLIFFPFLYGQNSYIHSNLSQLDSIDIISKQHCNEYKSTFKFSKEAINYDKKIIKFLNIFYQKDLNIKEISALLQSNFKNKWSIDTTNLGAATKHILRIYQRGNLGFEIAFTSLEDEIIYKKIMLRTSSEIRCTIPNDYWIETLDVKYLEKYCIPLIEFPITYRLLSVKVTSDTTYFHKLNNTIASKYYSFKIDSIKNLNVITWFDNDTYMADYAYFKDSSKLADVNMLYHFLYSPNHIIAINAYEALVYLKNVKQISFPLVMENKMNEIKNSDIKIRWQTSDVGHGGIAYKDLKVSTYQIISKFQKK
jgi:hypothetical protein